MAVVPRSARVVALGMTGSVQAIVCESEHMFAPMSFSEIPKLTISSRETWQGVCGQGDGRGGLDADQDADDLAAPILEGYLHPGGDRLTHREGGGSMTYRAKVEVAVVTQVEQDSLVVPTILLRISMSSKRRWEDRSSISMERARIAPDWMVKNPQIKQYEGTKRSSKERN